MSDEHSEPQPPDVASNGESFSAAERWPVLDTLARERMTYQVPDDVSQLSYIEQRLGLRSDSPRAKQLHKATVHLYWQQVVLPVRTGGKADWLSFVDAFNQLLGETLRYPTTLSQAYATR